VLTGSGHNTLPAEAHHLLSAGRDVIVLLGSFAAVAGMMSLVRPRFTASPREQGSIALRD
jgi:hypothetical protein